MKKINALILLLAGFGMNQLGNAMSTSGGVMDILGTGIALFGSILILYSAYRGIVFIWHKVSKKGKAGKKREGVVSN